MRVYIEISTKNFFRLLSRLANSVLSEMYVCLRAIILSCKIEIFLSQSDSSISSQNLYAGFELGEANILLLNVIELDVNESILGGCVVIVFVSFCFCCCCDCGGCSACGSDGGFGCCGGVIVDDIVAVVDVVDGKFELVVVVDKDEEVEEDEDMIA